MIGFQNILVHEYLDVDRGVVYEVLQLRLEDLRALKQALAQFLELDLTYGHFLTGATGGPEIE